MSIDRANIIRERKKQRKSSGTYPSDKTLREASKAQYDYLIQRSKEITSNQK